MKVLTRIWKCKACGQLHYGLESPAKCDAVECAKNDFEMIKEIQGEDETPDTRNVQLSMPDFETLIVNTVNKALSGMSKVDKRHAVYPGQNDDGKTTKEERTIRFFRALFAGDIGQMDELYKNSLAEGQDAVSKFQRDLATRTTLNEGTDAQGGYLVPPEFVNDVFSITEEYGIARRDCLVIPMARLVKNIQALASGITVYWPSEGSAITKSEPTFGRTVLTAKKVAALVANTEEFFEDSGVEVYQLIAALVGEKVAEAEDNKLFRGTGSSPAIYGILTKSGVNVVTMDTGSFADVTLKDMKNLPNALTKGARTGGKYYLHYNTLYHLSEERNNEGGYVWPNPNGAYPDRLAGWAWEDSEELPSDSDDAVDTAFACFGNLKKAVAFGDRKQLAVKIMTEGTVGTENLGEECKTALRFVERIDIAIFIASAMSRLKTAAS